MQTKKVIVLPYDPKWASDFQQIRDEIEDAVGHLILRVEHVGSTSVMGMSAKPCIDLDVVIADVPCSGYGIIRKKPDIRYKDPDTMRELPDLQLKILKQQARYVKPGGTLIYSTCTLVRKENEAVVEAFLKHRSDFTLEPLNLPEVFPKNTTGMLTLVPGEYDTDGFFIAKLRRKA